MHFSIIKKIMLGAVLLFSLQQATGYCASLSINEAVQMALQNNLDIKIAAKDEAKAKAELEATKAKDGMTISLKSSLSVADSVTDGVKKDFERDNDNSIAVSKSIYSAGKNKLNVQIKEDSLRQSGLNIERTAENIEYDTVKAYYDILQAKKTIIVDKESVANYEKHLTNVRNLYLGGSVPKSDLLRSEVELSNARQTLIKAANDYDIAVITFKNIVKMQHDEELILTDDFKYIPFEKSLISCLGYADDNRKDLQQAQIDCAIEEKNLKLAKAGYKPTIDSSLSVGWNKQPAPSKNDYNYTVGISASWDIFDNGITRANVDAAKAAWESAQLTLQQKKDDVDLAVRQAYLNMREAEKRVNTSETAVEQAQEDLFIAQEKYRVGAGIILDIIDAQLALSTASLDRISAQYDYARYMAQLENVMGKKAGELDI